MECYLFIKHTVGTLLTAFTNQLKQHRLLTLATLARGVCVCVCVSACLCHYNSISVFQSFAKQFLHDPSSDSRSRFVSNSLTYLTDESTSVQSSETINEKCGVGGVIQEDDTGM